MGRGIVDKEKRERNPKNWSHMPAVKHYLGKSENVQTGGGEKKEWQNVEPSLEERSVCLPQITEFLFALRRTTFPWRRLSIQP
jgi:hypothetical protein